MFSKLQKTSEVIAKQTIRKLEALFYCHGVNKERISGALVTTSLRGDRYGFRGCFDEGGHG